MLKTTDKSLYRRVGVTDIVAAQAQASASALYIARSLSHEYGDFDRLTLRYAAVDDLSTRFTPADTSAKRAMVARKVQQAVLSALRIGPKPWYGCAA